MRLLPRHQWILPLLSLAAPSITASDRPAEAAYASAQDCGRCHQAIYKYWSESPHARSVTNRAFQSALHHTAAAVPDQAALKRQCVWCHAPTTLLSGDIDLRQPISREGVTCDFCHTVAEIDLEREGHPFLLDPGPIKRGPLEYSESSGHRTAYSALHRASPLLCASCHEYRNGAGVAVLSTYTEWKEGPYPARGVPCQDCHMPLIPGATVKEGLGPPSLRVVNLHRVVGGSAQSQLERGLDLKIESLARSGGTAEVSVVVTNVAAGHAVPGGLATKSLVLAVGVETSGGSVENFQERIYRRELKDAQGRLLLTVADQFLRAAAVGRDTRLKPKEGRTERFTLPLPAGARAVVARLIYRDASDSEGEPVATLVTEVRRDLSSR